MNYLISKTFKLLLLSFVLITTVTSCNKGCNDCSQSTSKSIKYIDSNDANLLFGENAIYNPDSIKIKVGGENSINVWKYEENGIIKFDIEEAHSSYHIVLSDTLNDILDFELAERKSTRCCGNVTYSTKTKLNSMDIENNDLIIITH